MKSKQIIASVGTLLVLGIGGYEYVPTMKIGDALMSVAQYQTFKTDKIQMMKDKLSKNEMINYSELQDWKNVANKEASTCKTFQISNYNNQTELISRINNLMEKGACKE
jgi:hypothetical protein